MDHVDFHREPPAPLTTMVMACGGWIDAGEAATGAMRHLVRHFSAPRLASIDPEDFFDFTRERPTVSIQPDGQRAIGWPRSEFFAGQPPGGRDGLLLFRGMEPNLRWPTYTKVLLDVAEQCGVKRIVSLGALLAELPHTRPPLVTGRSTDPDWQARLAAWGIDRRSKYEGPTGISTVVLEAAMGRGMSSLTLMGQAPHYLQVDENPAVMQALLRYVTRLFDLGLAVSQFDEAIEAFRARCDEAVAQEPSVQAHVRQLEQDYDAAVDAVPMPLRDQDLNSEQLMQELEDFLREEREEGGER